jgi:prefoldin subunit 5
MAKQADVYTLTGLYQLRNIKMEKKLLEETIEELKNKIQSLEAENEKIRNALISHGIITP